VIASTRDQLAREQHRFACRSTAAAILPQLRARAAWHAATSRALRDVDPDLQRSLKLT